MRIGQNGPLDKFMRFLYYVSKCSMYCDVWRNKNLCETNLCDRHLTHIIRINKTRTEKCTFMVSLQAFP
jgi:hypothetical protein